MNYLAVLCAIALSLHCGASLSLKRDERCDKSLETTSDGDWSRVKGGNVTQLLAYGDYMYAIGTDKAVYRFNVWRHGDWEHVAPGNMTSIAIYDTEYGDWLYGVGEDGAVYVCKHIKRCSHWRKIADGNVGSIHVHDDYIFAIKQDIEDNAVWQTTYDGYWPWRRVTEGTSLDLTFTNRFMYGVGTDGAVWKSRKDGFFPWKKITDAPRNGNTTQELTQIDASNNYIYGVSGDGSAWRSEFQNGGRVSPWSKIGGERKVKHVAVRLLRGCGGADIYAVGEENDVWILSN